MDIFFRIQDDQRINYRYTYTLANLFGELGGIRELIMGILIISLRPFYRFYQTVSAGRALTGQDDDKKEKAKKEEEAKKEAKKVTDPEQNMRNSILLSSKDISDGDKFKAYINYSLGVEIFPENGVNKLENIKQGFTYLE